MKAIVWCVILLACNSNSKNGHEIVKEFYPIEKNSYSYNVFQKADSTFAYNILKGNEVIIHQETIPSKPGTKGFKDSIKAKQTAFMVVSMLNAGTWPPTIKDSQIDSILNLQ